MSWHVGFPELEWESCAEEVEIKLGDEKQTFQGKRMSRSREMDSPSSLQSPGQVTMLNTNMHISFQDLRSNLNGLFPSAL